MSTTNSTEETAYPWIVTSESGFNNYAVRRWSSQTRSYVVYVSGQRERMQEICDAMNRVAEMDAVVIEEGWTEPEPATPDSRTPKEAHALETVRQIRAVVQSWDDMLLKSREAVEGIRRIIKERVE